MKTKKPRHRARAHPHIRQRDKRAMEAGAALDEAMDALAQKNEDLTEDVQTFAKALDGLGEPLADAKAERRRLETIRAEYQSQRDHLLRKMAANESLPSDVKRTILEAAETG